MANTYKMTDRDIQQLILLRASNAAIFTGRKNSAMRGWRAIKRELGLQGLMSARQLKKKWDNLNQKYKIIKNPPEGEKPKNPRSWPWYFLMDDAVSGRLDNTAKIIQPLPIDDEKQEADLPLPPSSDTEDILSALNVVEMAPIEHEEDVEMIDKSGNYEETQRYDMSREQAPKITVKTLESAPSVPQTVATKSQQRHTQPPVLYATLLPDSTASVTTKDSATSNPRIVVQAKTVTNNNNNNMDAQNVQPTALLYATLLPDSTATSKNCTASSRNMALELAELQKKLAEFKKEKLTLEREQAAFDKELISLERDREQLNKERQMLDLERIEVERDRALVDKDRADLEREQVGVERDRLLLDRDRAYLERDQAFFERDKVFLDKAKEDFERQKEQPRSPNMFAVSGAEEEGDGGAVVREGEQMEVSEKLDDLANKAIRILMCEGDQEETKQRFATLVQKLTEKL